MRQCGDSFPSNSVREEKTDEIYPELSMKVSAPEKKFSLPNIQPTVIQALPSFKQTLPSLQPTEKLSLPAIQPRVKKAPSRPERSAVKRILPSIPAVEALTLPSIKGKSTASLQQPLRILPSTEKPDAHLTETKVQPKVKSVVKRVLPSIPTKEKLFPNIPTKEEFSLPSIEPTAVKAKPKVRPQRRRMLPCIPILPTIDEQTSPVSAEEDASGEGVPPAEQSQGVHPVEVVKSNVVSPGEDNALQSRELRQAESTLSTPQEVVQPTKAAFQQAKKKMRPIREEELRESARPRRNEAVQKTTKMTKGTQTYLQPSRQEVLPSLKPINKKNSEYSRTTLERLFPESQAERTDINRPRDKETLLIAQPKETLPRGLPQAPLKRVLPGIKPLLKKFPPSRQPVLGKALPRAPINKRTKASVQTTEAVALSSPQRTAEHRILRPLTVGEAKSSPQLTNGEPLANVQGTTGPQRRTTTSELLSPHRSQMESKCPRPPAAKQMLIPQISEEVTLEKVQRATWSEKKTKINEPSSPHDILLEDKIPRPPVGGGMKLSPQASEGETLASFQAMTYSKSKAPSRPQRPVGNTPSKPSTAPRTSKPSPSLPSVQSRQRETSPNFQPKPGSYAFLNQKRREFEELQRLQLTAKRNRAEERHSRDILTVKPALPGIQSAKEETALPQPHPPAKKGPQSTRPNVKRQRAKWRKKADMELPSLQLTVKQVLPNISSSNSDTFVKQPLPSIQPEQHYTVRGEADFQAIVNGNKQIPTHENLPGNERQ